MLEKGIKLRSKVLPYIGHNGGRLFSHKSSDLHNLSGNLFPAKVRANPPSKPVDTPQLIDYYGRAKGGKNVFLLKLEKKRPEMWPALIKYSDLRVPYVN